MVMSWRYLTPIAIYFFESAATSVFLGFRYGLEVYLRDANISEALDRFVGHSLGFFGSRIFLMQIVFELAFLYILLYWIERGDLLSVVVAILLSVVVWTGVLYALGDEGQMFFLAIVKSWTFLIAGSVVSWIFCMKLLRLES